MAKVFWHKGMLLLPVAFILGLTMLSPPAQEAKGQSISANSSGQFSRPIWFPLREPAAIGCVQTNCYRSPTHSYEAVDLFGSFGDPVHAAGAGTVYIDVANVKCTESNKGGRLWIDHGGGEVTRYRHLGKITVRDGQSVTPDTKIGEMGRGGSQCNAEYLHYERRANGPLSERVYMGDLYACVNGSRRTYPQDAGLSVWNDADPYSSRTFLRSEGTSCATTSPRSGPVQNVAAAKRGERAATISWTLPAQSQHVREYRISYEMMRPRAGNWARPKFITVPVGETSFTLRNLTKKRRYRTSVAAIDGAGANQWVTSNEFMTADPPSKPRLVKSTYGKRKSYVKWNRPKSNGGTKLRYFEVALVKAKNTDEPRWKRVKPSSRDYEWRKLRKRGNYVMLVRAANDAGAGKPLRVAAKKRQR